MRIGSTTLELPSAGAELRVPDGGFGLAYRESVQLLATARYGDHDLRVGWVQINQRARDRRVALKEAKVIHAMKLAATALAACGHDGHDDPVPVPVGPPPITGLGLRLTRVGPESIQLDGSYDPYTAVYEVSRDGYPLASVRANSLIDASGLIGDRYCDQVVGRDGRGVVVSSSSVGCLTLFRAVDGGATITGARSLGSCRSTTPITAATVSPRSASSAITLGAEEKTMSRSPRGARPPLALAVVALLLSACGGGSIDVTPDPATQPVTVSGTVFKGPVADARVCASWFVDGTADASTTLCTTSGPDGRYTLTLPRRAAVLQVEATQGSYVDEAVPTTRVPLSRLRGAVAFSGPESTLSVQVTAMTELAVRRASARGPLGAATLADGEAEVRKAFGISNSLHATAPADATGPRVTSLDDATLYGLVNAGVRGWMAERGRPAAELDAALDTLAAKLAAGTLYEELDAFRAGIKRVLDASPTGGLRPLSSGWSQAVPLQFGSRPVTPAAPRITETDGTLRYAMPWVNPVLVVLFGGAPAACVTNVPPGTTEAAVRAAAQPFAAQIGQEQTFTLQPVASCKGLRTGTTIDFPSGRRQSGDPD